MPLPIAAWILGGIATAAAAATVKALTEDDDKPKTNPAKEAEEERKAEEIRKQQEAQRQNFSKHSSQFRDLLHGSLPAEIIQTAPKNSWSRFGVKQGAEYFGSPDFASRALLLGSSLSAVLTPKSDWPFPTKGIEESPSTRKKATPKIVKSRFENQRLYTRQENPELGKALEHLHDILGDSEEYETIKNNLLDFCTIFKPDASATEKLKADSKQMKKINAEIDSLTEIYHQLRKMKKQAESASETA